MFILMTEFANSNLQDEGAEFFSARRREVVPQLTPVQKSLYLGLIGSLRAQPFGEFHSRIVLVGRLVESVETDDSQGSWRVSRPRYRLFADRACPRTFQRLE